MLAVAILSGLISVAIIAVAQWQVARTARRFENRAIAEKVRKNKEIDEITKEHSRQTEAHLAVICALREALRPLELVDLNRLKKDDVFEVAPLARGMPPEVADLTRSEIERAKRVLADTNHYECRDRKRPMRLSN